MTIVVVVMMALMSEASENVEKAPALGWLGLTHKEKTIYSGGYNGGMSSCCMGSNFNNNYEDCIRTLGSYNIDDQIIVAAVTNFYKDPLNAYIPIPMAFKISIQQIKGEDMSGFIQLSRAAFSPSKK